MYITEKIMKPTFSDWSVYCTYSSVQCLGQKPSGYPTSLQVPNDTSHANPTHSTLATGYNIFPHSAAMPRYIQYFHNKDY
jgi:hypothetical protein